jgi:hypothetical protein
MVIAKNNNEDRIRCINFVNNLKEIGEKAFGQQFPEWKEKESTFMQYEHENNATLFFKKNNKENEENKEKRTVSYFGELLLAFFYEFIYNATDQQKIFDFSANCYNKVFLNKEKFDESKILFQNKQLNEDYMQLLFEYKNLIFSLNSL